MSNTANVIAQYLKLKSAGIEESIIPAVIDAIFVLQAPKQESKAVEIQSLFADVATAITYPKPVYPQPKSLKELVLDAIATIKTGATFTNNDILAIVQKTNARTKLMQVSAIIAWMNYPKVPGTPYKAVYLKQ